MTVSSTGGRPGDDGEDGDDGPRGRKPVIAFGNGSEEVELADGDSGCQFTAPEGVNALSVHVEPVNLGTASISSIDRSGQVITVALTAAIAGEDKLVRFVWPVYTVTYEEDPE